LAEGLFDKAVFIIDRHDNGDKGFQINRPCCQLGDCTASNI
jgi:hypothetical protein